MLPSERATILRGRGGGEMKHFSKLIPGLLESYTKPNMMKCMSQLDKLISSRLNATEKQRKFQELANFEQMARENLEIEREVREKADYEKKEKDEKEAKEAAAKLAERAARRAGGSSSRRSSSPRGRGSSNSRPRSRTSMKSPSTSPTISGRRLRGTATKEKRSRRDSQEGVDAIELELAKTGIREMRKTLSYKKKLKQPLKIGGKN